MTNRTMLAMSLTTTVGASLFAVMSSVVAAEYPPNFAVAAQSLTLPELVRRQAPQPLWQSRIRELFPDALEEMLPKTDLIVQGTVDQFSTHLSTDQTELYTDYVIAPLRIVRRREVKSSGGISLPAPIVLTRWGGQMLIDGVSVTVEDANLPAFHVGEQLWLMLVYNRPDGKYQLPGAVSGAFAVEGGKIRPLVQHPVYERFRGMSVAEIESEVRRLSR